MGALAVLLGTAVLVSAYVAVTALRAGESAHYDVTALTVGFAFAAGLAIAAGVVALRVLRSAALGALFAGAVGTLSFAFLAMFSIGLAVLPVGLVLLGLAVRRATQHPSRTAVRAAAAGAAIGIGGVAYLLVLLQPGVAECRIGGGSTSSGGLFGPIAGSGGSYQTAHGEGGGFIDEGDRIAFFSCEGARMTDFRRVSLPRGEWLVTTQPAPTVGREVMIIFRYRPRPAEQVGIHREGLEYTATCRTCPEPRPTISGRAAPAQSGSSGSPGESIVFVDLVAFPAAGSWYTAPIEGGIEVR